MMIITHRARIWFPDIGAIRPWDQFGTNGNRLQGLRHRRLKKESNKRLQAAGFGQGNLWRGRKRHLAVPSNVTFIAIDFDKESLPAKLGDAGFHKGQRSLFVLEGLLMYLQPESVEATFRMIQEHAGERSWVVFDYVYASVLRNEKLHYGESEVVASVTRAGERWSFAIERGKVEQFLANYGLTPIDEKDAQELEKTYFSEPSGKIVGRVNGAHCLVTAEKR